MNIEKINDNQIRATITRDDLEERDIKLSELSYGSEKTKSLFQDLMHQAYEECGFESDNIPLMVEAIPVSLDCLILVVTRVEDPDQLDSSLPRLSRSRPAAADNGDSDSKSESSEDMFHQILKHFTDSMKKKQEDTSSKTPKKASPSGSHSGDSEKKSDVHAFTFSSMNIAASSCAVIEPFFQGESSLYRDQLGEDYVLILNRPREDDGSYDRACRILCDFGLTIRPVTGLEAYFREHFRTVLSRDAVSVLSGLA